jgi:hypothetical protein
MGHLREDQQDLEALRSALDAVVDLALDEAKYAIARGRAAPRNT